MLLANEFSFFVGLIVIRNYMIELHFISIYFRWRRFFIGEQFKLNFQTNSFRILNLNDFKFRNNKPSQSNVVSSLSIRILRSCKEIFYYVSNFVRILFYNFHQQQTTLQFHLKESHSVINSDALKILVNSAQTNLKNDSNTEDTSTETTIKKEQG